MKISSVLAIVCLLACDPKAMFAELEEASARSDRMEEELKGQVAGEPSVTWNKTNGIVTIQVDFRGPLEDEDKASKAAEELAKKHFPEADQVIVMRCTLEPGNVNRCRQI